MGIEFLLKMKKKDQDNFRNFECLSSKCPKEFKNHNKKNMIQKMNRK